ARHRGGASRPEPCRGAARETGPDRARDRRSGCVSRVTEQRILAMPLRIVLVVLALLTLTACPSTKRYEVTGVVLKNDVRGQLTVSHDPIAGYMDAMVMPFTVRAVEEAAGIRAGDRISFRLNVTQSASFIDRIQVLSAGRRDAGLLRSPTTNSLVDIGMPFPDFSLIDQNGERRSLHALTGQVVVVTFIYTRCPLPDY